MMNVKFKKSISILLVMIMMLTLVPTVLFASANTDEGLSAVYVAGSKGNDSNDGSTNANAVSTMQKAYDLVKNGGTIVLCGDVRTKEELLPAKAVTITSKHGNEDFMETASLLVYDTVDTHFQADTVLQDLSIKTSKEGYGFIANGHKFHVAQNVKVQAVANANAQVYIAGGRSTYAVNKGADVKDGADILVDSGSCWLIYGAGEAVFGRAEDVFENTAPINIKVTGNTQVKTIVAGFKTSTQPDDDEDSGICKFGDVNITVTDTATVRQVYLGSECYNSGHSEQTENGVVTLNMGSDTTFGSVYGTGQYAYHESTANYPGEIQVVSNVVINYYGGKVGSLSLGGVDVVYHPFDKNAYPTETMKEITVNLYAPCEVLTPGFKYNGYGVTDDGTLTTERARINVINNNKFALDPLTGSGYSAYEPQQIITRIVRYTNSGSIETPQVVQDDYIPHIIELATGADDADLEKLDTNVFQTSSDFELNGISLDKTSSTIQLVGNNKVPVITATDFVNDYRIDDGLKNTFENENPGKIVLSFLNNEGEKWQPQDGTVVFQVPIAESTGKTGQAVLDMFSAPYMEEGYSLAYQDGTYSNGTDEKAPIGQIIVVKNYDVTFKAGDHGTIGTNQNEITETLRTGSTYPAIPKTNPNTDYAFDYWADVNGTKVESFPETVTESATYTAIWKKTSEDISIITPIAAAYKVEHYQEQSNGSFVLYETEFPLVGKLGETVNAVAKTYPHYTEDTENSARIPSGIVFAPVVSENSEPQILTLKLYYKLDRVTVTFKAGEHGTIGEKQDVISDTFVYGNAYPAIPSTSPDIDYVFDYWKDANGNKVENFPETVTETATYTAVWKQLKYTLHYNDGRDNDGIWGYNYAENTNGYYTPDDRKELPTEVRHFTEGDINGEIEYEGVTVPGIYFLSWTREENGEKIAENTTPSADCGDIDYHARWILIKIDIIIQTEVNVQITGEISGDLVTIKESQKEVLAKNINIKEDVVGVNCEIDIAAYVKDVINQTEKASADKKILADFGKIDNILYYDVSVVKTIWDNNVLVSQTELKKLAAPIEVQFSVPQKWQSGGKVYMYRTHTDSNGEVTTALLENFSTDPTLYIARTDEFSTYTMIYVPNDDATDGSAVVQKPTVENTSVNTVVSPHTGENNNLAFWFALMFVSLIILVAIVLFKRKCNGRT